MTLVTGMFITVIILFYFWFLEKPYLTYQNIPFPPVIAEIHAGDIVPLNVVRCNSDRYVHNYESSHSLLNVETLEPILMPDIKVMISPGCHKGISLINKVPAEAPPGRYVVFGTADVYGTLREFHIEWRSEEFIVLPPKQVKK